MLKKIVVGVLVLTVIGGSVLAVLDRPNVVASETLSSTPSVPSLVGTASSTQPAQGSTSSVGEVWSGSGTILALTDVGMTLALQDGSEVYVELGSPEYWQAQGVTLNAGAVVSVDGFFNGTDYHARTVTTSKGEVLSLRNEAGQPLWAGGSANSNGNGTNGGQGEAQVPADQWITVSGTITALTNNGVVVQTTDGQSLTVSFGRADFWQTQSITFAAGDAVSMLGFWQGTQFNPGQVTKIATGERIMLRDPNGRPLWAGPGRSQNGGNGNNNGNGNGTGGQGKGKNNQGRSATPQPTSTANP
ncbi:MAG: hypothetical protein KF716_21520 [Anaerolineae bacterium]|nr:hypothetical protein [Anaerolineae bacterium]